MTKLEILLRAVKTVGRKRSLTWSLYSLSSIALDVMIMVWGFAVAAWGFRISWTDNSVAKERGWDRSKRMQVLQVSDGVPVVMVVMAIITESRKLHRNVVFLALGG